MASPELKGEARAAVEHRGSPVQIIASAGSGKTEVISQRVVSLLADGVGPEGIVAFTFTEKAAAELKSRIQDRALERIGESALSKLAGVSVGTIHSYCFRLLQRYVPRYEAYDVLEDNRLAAFLTREARSLGLKQLDGTLFASMRTFIANLEVVENELVDPRRLRSPFREIYASYLERLDAFRALTFGQIIARAVAELERPEVFEAVHAPLRHLIVDEYQDVNPAQERLVALLAGQPVELCVVGDDDQAVYQWRGTDVRNIVEFADRYPGTRTFRIETNRRSRPDIIAIANRCSRRIEDRLPKRMKPDRAATRDEVVLWAADSESEQADTIAAAIRAAHDKGHAYREMAVLLRGRTSLPAILAALERADIPVKPGGRTALFGQPDAQQFGRLCAWLVDHDWRPERYGGGEQVTLETLLEGYRVAFELSKTQRATVRDRLVEMKQEVVSPTRRANLVRDFYLLLRALGVDAWDPLDPMRTARLGVLARCSQILADFESVRRRARVDPDRPGELIGGQDRGEWHFRWLAIYVQNWAQGAYEDFDGAEAVPGDAVEVTTVHQAKGLEWPIVFVPSLVDRRFPSSQMGKSRARWYVPDTLFDPVRYNGTENDERRLFYVALTRARDQLHLSYFSAYDSGSGAAPSRFLGEVHDGEIGRRRKLPAPPTPDRGAADEPPVELTLSDLVLFDDCGTSYLLRSVLGFQPTLAPELGYGRAVHHVLREVADHVRRHQRVPSNDELDRLFDEEFYLPAATKATHSELKRKAKTLVASYVTEHADELAMTWDVERPFELRLGSALISGRADVILDLGADGRQRLRLLDYKTATSDDDAYDFQLQVYADAGRQEDLSVDSAYVHDLGQASRRAVDVSEPAVSAARDRAEALVQDMRQGRFDANPGPRCRRCDVAPICKSADRRR